VVAPTTEPAKLPVSPLVVSRAIKLLRDEDVSLSELEHTVAADPVVAASILSVANAALYAPVATVKTIGRAISHIGLNATKKVLMAATMRPLFASGQLRNLWQHSLEVATIAERFARMSGAANPAEAFVLGLLHDIGRIALEVLPAEAVARHRRIATGARCTVLADIIVLGCDHGELGAKFLRHWGLPVDLTVPIEYHHRPELNPGVMEQILYLAEVASEGDEDVPSAVRINIALPVIGARSVDDLFEHSALDKRIASVLALAG
jgi:putative nucleotidyltransferase with HDIG domain